MFRCADDREGLGKHPLEARVGVQVNGRHETLKKSVSIFNISSSNNGQTYKTGKDVCGSLIEELLLV